jgi:hypothetical protein
VFAQEVKTRQPTGANNSVAASVLLPAKSEDEKRPAKAGPTTHDFSRVRLTSALARSSELHQLDAEQEESPEEFAEDGALVMFQSGTCQNGGANSSCHFDTGEFRMNQNFNTCCTKSCTVSHEGVHKTDIDGWGCCAAASKAWNAPGANKDAVAKTYNEWQNKVTPITECHAYTRDVGCADAFAKAKDCSGDGKGTDCCKDIEDYKTRYGDLAKTNCAKPQTPVPCPAF